MVKPVGVSVTLKLNRYLLKAPHKNDSIKQFIIKVLLNPNHHVDRQRKHGHKNFAGNVCQRFIRTLLTDWMGLSKTVYF